MSPALYGWVASGLLWGALAAHLPLGRWRPLAGVLAMAAALAPVFGGESLAHFTHGVLGAPSFTLALLALATVAGYPPPALNGGPYRAYVAFAVGFYALALGLGPVDPYGPGYQPMVILLFVVSPYAWLLHKLRQDAWMLILAADLAAYAAGLFGNLWDALFDPLLLLVALALPLIRRRRAADV